MLILKQPGWALTYLASAHAGCFKITFSVSIRAELLVVVVVEEFSGLCREIMDRMNLDSLMRTRKSQLSGKNIGFNKGTHRRSSNNT